MPEFEEELSSREDRGFSFESCVEDLSPIPLIQNMRIPIETSEFTDGVFELENDLFANMDASKIVYNNQEIAVSFLIDTEQAPIPLRRRHSLSPTSSMTSFVSAQTMIRTRSLGEGELCKASSNESILHEDQSLRIHGSSVYIETGINRCDIEVDMKIENKEPTQSGSLFGNFLKRYLPRPAVSSTSDLNSSNSTSINNNNSTNCEYTQLLPQNLTPNINIINNHLPLRHITSSPIEISSDLGSSPDTSQTTSPSCSPPNFFSYFSNQSSHHSHIALSLCGGLLADKLIDDEIFEKYLVTYEKFASNANILNNQNLVVRINGRYLGWKVAAPLLMSQICFNHPLPTDSFSKLCDEHMVKKPSSSRSWFPWRKNYDSRTSNLIEDKPSRANKHSISNKSEDLEFSTTSQEKEKTTEENETSSVITSKMTNLAENSLEGIEDPLLTSNINTPIIDNNHENSAEHIKPFFHATNLLTTDQLASLPIHEGANEVTLSVITKYQGTCTVSCILYMWNYFDKIVISDIDGTITKSDKLGQILPIFGKDWTHLGVTDLFRKIEANGYKFIYLSARAIGQSNPTRGMLRNIRQNSKTLPDGPVLLAPLSLYHAFHQEVIAKKPEQYKIPCLKEVMNLFGPSATPFFAGYGNRKTDVTSYSAVKVQKSRIFIVNPKGELRYEQAHTFLSSYNKLCEYVDFVFPPLRGAEMPPDNDFSDFTFWKDNFCDHQQFATEFYSSLTKM